MMAHAEAHERIAELALEPGALAAALATDGAGNPDLSAHVATCERCRADIETWRGVHGSLERSLRSSGPDGRAGIDPIEPGDELRSGILQAARAAGRGAGTTVERGGRIGSAPLRVSSTILGLAAALLVAVAGTLL